MNDDILTTAKHIERNLSDETLLRIKLTLLQDLIAEIERLRAIKPQSIVGMGQRKEA